MRIGKNILENLTTGMYEDSKIVFREYIQNASDSIDKAIESGLIRKEEARIEIDIDAKKRIIEISDNGIGISVDNVKDTLTNIADSNKVHGEDKGFRGIGRLGGIAYCDELVFETTYSGELTKTRMSWNGKKSREIFNDPSQRPTIQELLSDIISFENKEDMGSEKHNFKVILNNVIDSNNELLDVTKIREYLSFVAPLPYSTSFIFRSEIYKYIEKNGLSLCEYNIFVNGQQLFKEYAQNLYEQNGNTKKKYDEIYELAFNKYYSKSNKELIAWSWIGISGFEKNIPSINVMRGVRLRKDNIQIGNSETMSKFFSESRGGHYFIGEVHGIDRLLIPNARRDYFNETEIYKEFEYDLYEYFGKNGGSKTYHFANQVKLAIRDKNKYQEELKVFKQTQFLDNDDEDTALENLEIMKGKAEKAENTLKLREAEADGNKVLGRVFEAVHKNHKTKTSEHRTAVSPLPEKKDKEKRFISQNLSKLSKKEQKLVKDVYTVIKNVLPKDNANMLIQKIQEELNK